MIIEITSMDTNNTDGTLTFTGNSLENLLTCDMADLDEDASCQEVKAVFDIGGMKKYSHRKYLWKILEGQRCTKTESSFLGKCSALVKNHAIISISENFLEKD